MLDPTTALFAALLRPSAQRIEPQRCTLE